MIRSGGEIRQINRNRRKLVLPLLSRIPSRILLFAALAAIAAWVLSRQGGGDSFFLTAWADESPRYQFHPWSLLARQIWAEGRLPLWDVFAGTGAPLAANPQAAVFNLFRLPFDLSGALGQLDAMIVIRLAVAGFFAYRLMRRMGAPVSVGWWGALAYMLQPYFLKWPNMPYLDSHAWLPAVCWSLVRFQQHRKGMDAALAILFLGFLLLGGHPEAVFFDVLFIIGFVLLALPGGWNGFDRGGRLAIAGALAGLAALMASPMLLPFLEYLPQSWHYHAAHTGWIAFPFKELPALWLPGYAGGLRDQVLAARDIPPGYGMTLAILTLAAVAALPRMTRPAAYGAGFAIAGLGLAFGIYPFKLLGLLPGLAQSYNFRYPLAGITLGLLLAIEPLMRSPRRQPGATGVFVCLTGLLLVTLAFRVFFPLPYGDPSPSALLWGMAALVVLAFMVAGLRPGWMAWPRLAVLASVVMSVHAGESINQPVERTNYNSLLHQDEPEWTEPGPEGRSAAPVRIQADHALFLPGWAYGWGWADTRIANPLVPKRYAEYLMEAAGQSPAEFAAGFAAGFAAMPQPDDLATLADLGVAWLGTPDWTGSSSPVNLAYASGHAPMRRGQAYGPYNALVQLVPDRVKLSATSGDMPWLVFTPAPLLSARPEAEEGLWFMVLDEGRPAYVEFRRPARMIVPRPPARFIHPQVAGHSLDFIAFPAAGEAINAAAWADVLERGPMLEGATQGLSDAWARWFRVPDSQPRAGVLQPDGTLLPARINSNHSDEVEIVSPAPGTLVLRDTYYPGWRASVEGKEVPIQPHRILFRSVEVPGADVQVRFWFQPWSVRIALALALPTAILWVFFLLAAQFARPRNAA